MRLVCYIGGCLCGVVYLVGGLAIRWVYNVVR